MNQCDCPTSIVYVLFHEKEILRDSWWIRFERFVLFLGMLIELYFTKIFNYSFVSSLTITKWYNGSVWPSKTLIITLHIKEYVSHFNQIEMWQKSNSFCGIFPNFVNISNSSGPQDSCQVTYIIIFFFNIILFEHGSSTENQLPNQSKHLHTNRLLTPSEHGHNRITDLTGFGTHSKCSGSNPKTSQRLHKGDTPNLWTYLLSTYQ